MAAGVGDQLDLFEEAVHRLQWVEAAVRLRSGDHLTPLSARYLRDAIGDLL